MSENVYNECRGKDIENPISNDSTRDNIAVEITELNNKQISEKEQKVSELLIPNKEQQGASKDDESTLTNDAEVKKKCEVNLIEKLNNLHCPFVWQADLHIKSYGDNDYDLLTEAADMFEETGFRFRRYNFSVVYIVHDCFIYLVL